MSSASSAAGASGADARESQESPDRRPGLQHVQGKQGFAAGSGAFGATAIQNRPRSDDEHHGSAAATPNQARETEGQMLSAQGSAATQLGKWSPGQSAASTQTGKWSHSSWTHEERIEYVRSLGIVTLPGEEVVLRFLGDAIARAPLPSPWHMARDSQGRTFFANRSTGASTWTHPLEPSLRELAGVCRMCLTFPPPLRESTIATLLETWQSEAKQELAKWYSVKHENGKEYYCHRETWEAMWEHPAEVVLPMHYLKIRSIEKIRDEGYLTNLRNQEVASTSASQQASQVPSQAASVAATPGGLPTWGEEATPDGSSQSQSQVEAPRATAGYPQHDSQNTLQTGATLHTPLSQRTQASVRRVSANGTPNQTQDATTISHTFEKEQQLNTLRSELAEARQRHQQEVARSSNTQEEAHRQRMQLRDLDDVRRDLETQLSEASAAKSSLQEELRVAEQQLQASDAGTQRTAQLEGELQEARRATEEQASDCQELSLGFRRALESVAEAERGKLFLEVRLAAMYQDEVARDSILFLQDDVNRAFLEAAYVEEAGRRESLLNLDESRQAVQEQLESVSHRQAGLEEELAAAEQELRESQAVAQDFKEWAVTAGAELEQERAQRIALEELSADRGASVRQAVELQARLAEAEQQLAESRAGVAGGDGDQSELRAQLEALSVKKGTVQTELESAQQELGAAKAAGESAKDRAVQAEAQLAADRRNFDQALELMREAERARAVLEAKLEVVEKGLEERDSLAGKVQQLQAELSQAQTKQIPGDFARRPTSDAGSGFGRQAELEEQLKQAEQKLRAAQERAELLSVQAMAQGTQDPNQAAALQELQAQFAARSEQAEVSLVEERHKVTLAEQRLEQSEAALDRLSAEREALAESLMVEKTHSTQSHEAANTANSTLAGLQAMLEREQERERELSAKAAASELQLAEERMRVELTEYKLQESTNALTTAAAAQSALQANLTQEQERHTQLSTHAAELETQLAVERRGVEAYEKKLADIQAASAKVEEDRNALAVRLAEEEAARLSAQQSLEQQQSLAKTLSEGSPVEEITKLLEGEQEKRGVLQQQTSSLEVKLQQERDAVQAAQTRLEAAESAAKQASESLDARTAAHAAEMAALEARLEQERRNAESAEQRLALIQAEGEASGDQRLKMLQDAEERVASLKAELAAEHSRQEGSGSQAARESEEQLAALRAQLAEEQGRQEELRQRVAQAETELAAEREKASTAPQGGTAIADAIEEQQTAPPEEAAVIAPVKMEEMDFQQSSAPPAPEAVEQVMQVQQVQQVQMQPAPSKEREAELEAVRAELQQARDAEEETRRLAAETAKQHEEERLRFERAWDCVHEAERAKNEMEERLQAVERSLNESQQASSTSEDLIRNLQASLAESQQRQAQLSLKHDAMAASLAAAQAEQAQEESRIEKLTLDMSEMEAFRSSAQAALDEERGRASQLSGRCRELEALSEEARKEAAEAQDRLAAKEAAAAAVGEEGARIEQMTLDLQSLEAWKSTAQAELDQERERAKQLSSRCRELEQLSSQAKADLAEAQERSAAAGAAVEAAPPQEFSQPKTAADVEAQAALAEERERAGQLDSRCKELEQLASEAAADLTQAQERAASLEERLAQAQEAADAQAKAQVDKMALDLEALEATRSSAQAALDEERERAKQLSTRCKSLEMAAQAQIQEAADPEAAQAQVDLAKEKAEAQLAAEQATAQVEKMALDLQALEAAKSSAQERAASLEEQLAQGQVAAEAQAKAQIDKMALDLEALEATKSSAQAALDEERERAKQLSSRCKSLEMAAQAQVQAAADPEAAQAQADLAAQKAEAELAAAQATAQVEKMTLDLQALEAAKSSAQERAASLEEQLAQGQQAAETQAKAQIDKMSLDLEALEATKSSAQAALEEERERAKQLSTRCKSLEMAAQAQVQAAADPEAAQAQVDLAAEKAEAQLAAEKATAQVEKMTLDLQDLEAAKSSAQAALDEERERAKQLSGRCRELEQAKAELAQSQAIAPVPVMMEQSAFESSAPPAAAEEVAQVQKVQLQPEPDKDQGPGPETARRELREQLEKAVLAQEQLREGLEKAEAEVSASRDQGTAASERAAQAEVELAREREKVQKELERVQEAERARAELEARLAAAEQGLVAGGQATTAASADMDAHIRSLRDELKMEQERGDRLLQAQQQLSGTVAAGDGLRSQLMQKQAELEVLRVQGDTTLDRAARAEAQLNEEKKRAAVETKRAREASDANIFLQGQLAQIEKEKLAKEGSLKAAERKLQEQEKMLSHTQELERRLGSLEPKLEVLEQVYSPKAGASADAARVRELERRLAEAELQSSQSAKGSQSVLEQKLREATAWQAQLRDELSSAEKELSSTKTMTEDFKAFAAQAQAALEQERKRSEKTEQEVMELSLGRDEALSAKSKLEAKLLEMERKFKAAGGFVDPVDVSALKPQQAPELRSAAPPAPVAAVEPAQARTMVKSRPPPQDAEPVKATFKVESLDYDGLLADRNLRAAFEATVRQTLASEAAAPVSKEHVKLVITAGSVVVQATIEPPPGAESHAVAHRLRFSPTLSRKLAAYVGALEGIQRISSGPIKVTDFSVLFNSELLVVEDSAQSPPGAGKSKTLAPEDSELLKDGKESGRPQAQWEPLASKFFNRLDRLGTGFVEKFQVLQLWPLLSRQMDCSNAAALAAQLLQSTSPMNTLEWMALMKALHSIVGPRRLRRNLRSAEAYYGELHAGSILAADPANAGSPVSPLIYKEVRWPGAHSSSR